MASTAAEEPASASRAAHVRTTGPAAGSSSQYKGVTKSGNEGRPWQARLGIDRKHYYLGRYASEVEAARAYNAAQAKFVGFTSGAYFNDIPKGSRFGRIVLPEASLLRLNNAAAEYRLRSKSETSYGHEGKVAALFARGVAHGESEEQVCVASQDVRRHQPGRDKQGQ